MKYDNKINEIDKLNGKIDQFRPINKVLLKQIKEYFRISLTYSSNAIEGNTLTETETKVVLEDGLTIAGRPLKDHYEASGHSEAYDMVFDLAKKKTITEKDILNIHRLFYYRIDNENAGHYREVPVVITGTEYVPPAPSKIPTLMKKFVAKIPSLKKKHHPIEAAALIHKELVGIHPFVDGNGRTARLLMNLSLFQAGYTITIIPPILRADYIALIKQSQTGKK
ncbi:MAG: cell filamentation protein Fic, partial [Bdellovibrionales bacterium RIFOXYC2_FULL_39_8]